MFGYVKPYIPDLKVRQHMLYKAFYCGLCKRQKKLTGIFSSLTLSYDFVSLALVRSLLTNEKLELKNGRCPFNPFKKRQYISANPTLDYTARVASLLNYYKVKDDLKDTKGIKKLKYLVILPFLSHSKKKALKCELGDEEIRNSLKRLGEIENGKNSAPGDAAQEFGELLAGIASFGIEDPLAKTAAEKIFFSIGKWIYTVDALDDLKSDLRNNNYNPFIGEELLKDGKISDAAAANLSDDLQLILKESDKYIQCLSCYDRDIVDIIENIYLLGTQKVGDEIIQKLKN